MLSSFPLSFGVRAQLQSTRGRLGGLSLGEARVIEMARSVGTNRRSPQRRGRTIPALPSESFPFRRGKAPWPRNESDTDPNSAEASSETGREEEGQAAARTDLAPGMLFVQMSNPAAG